MQFHDKFGIYVHVPFCAKPCRYCRFYKKIPDSGDIAAYISAIGREARAFIGAHPGAPAPDTAFWGGGTPSILSPGEILRLAKELAPLRPSREWTVEISPSTTTPEKLAALKEAGATRISLGVQSFSEKTLAALGRAHTLAQTMRAVELAANAGFPHFSIDLIFGARGQTLGEFAADMRAAAAAGAAHISAYCLEFESGTSACAGLKTDADLQKNAADAEMFEAAMDTLPALGFSQYEISNYAKTPADRCLHNLCTWHMAQWVGFGPAAASQFGGRRYRNCASLKKWAAAAERGESELEDIVELDDAEMFSSALIFGLRLNEGVDFESLKARFPAADAEKYKRPLESLESLGLVQTRGGVVKLTRKGRLYADSVAVELL